MVALDLVHVLEGFVAVLDLVHVLGVFEALLDLGCALEGLVYVLKGLVVAGVRYVHWRIWVRRVLWIGKS